MIHFKQHIPSCCDYGEPVELDFETLEDLLKDLESNYDFCPPRYDLVWSCDSEPDEDGRQYLMMSSTIEKDSWYVMGFITGIDLSKYLPQFDKVYKEQQTNDMNLDRKTLFEEMNKIGMFEEDEYDKEDFESICEDLAELIWFVDTLFSENDLETIKKLFTIIFYKHNKELNLLSLLEKLGLIEESEYTNEDLEERCNSLPDCLNFVDYLSIDNDENTFKKLLLCILYKEN